MSAVSNVSQADSETEIKTKVGRWKIRVTEAGGLDVEYEANEPSRGYFEVTRDYDKDAAVLIPRRRGPSCSGGG